MKDEPRKSGRSLVLEVELPAEPDEVWRMLTDPVELARWFAPLVEGGGQPGETLLFGWGPDIRWRTVVESAERGVSVRWRDELEAYDALEPSGAPKIVEWLLSSERGTTRLRLVHSGFGDGAGWDEMYDATRFGWSYYLWHFQQTLQHHRGAPRTVLSARRPSSESREAVSARLFGPAGLDLRPAATAGKESTLALGKARERLWVEFSQPGHLWGRLPGLGEALLFVEMEPGRDSFHTGLWLSTWGLEPFRQQSVQSALDAVADRVFGPAPGR